MAWTGKPSPFLEGSRMELRRDFALCKVHPKFKMRFNFLLNTITLFFSRVIEDRHVFSPSFQAFVVV
jgi:hypothetical protein